MCFTERIQKDAAMPSGSSCEERAIRERTAELRFEVLAPDREKKARLAV
jgi:hypothetical protein